MAAEANCASLYREGQEDQLGALGLVVNIIVLWNTIYMNTALYVPLRDQSELIVPEDIVRLSTLRAQAYVLSWALQLLSDSRRPCKVTTHHGLGSEFS